jgi:hypothetical protein
MWMFGVMHTMTMPRYAMVAQDTATLIVKKKNCTHVVQLTNA